MPPLLSIIVPVFRVRPYLDQCVRSLLEQDYTTIEVILVDDGCPDGCGALCDAWAERDERVVVVHQNNQGQAAARNRGLDRARGVYISFIDSDDYVSQDYFTSHIAYLEEHPEVAISVASVVRVNEEGVILSPARQLQEVQLLEGQEAVSDFFFSSPFELIQQCIYRWEVWSTIRFPEGIIFEDTFMLPSICRHTERMFVSLQGVHYYRQRKGATTSTFGTWHMHCITRVHPELLDYFYEVNRRLYYDRLAVAYIYLRRYGDMLPHQEYITYKAKLRKYPILLWEVWRMPRLKWTHRLRLTLCFCGILPSR